MLDSHRFSPLTFHAACSAVLAVGFVCSGCGAGDRASAGVAVCDSAGITIVENSGDGLWQPAEAWHLSAEPTVDIGVLEGAPEYQLFRVRGAVRLSDGRIVVANSGTFEMRFYSADGQHLQSVGGEGGGPGEFEAMGAVTVFADDSLMVGDWRASRTSIFDANGRFVRSFTLERASEDLSFPRVAGSLGDSALLVTVGRVYSSRDALESGPSLDSASYFRYTFAGIMVDTIGKFPRTEAFLDVGDNGGFTVTSLGFGRNGHAGIGNGRFYYGWPDRYEIEVYSHSGVLERVIRRDKPNLPVTPEAIERYKSERLRNASSDNWRRRIGSMLSEMPFPETMPAYGGLEVDAIGNLWVSVYYPPGDERSSWDVFDPDGRFLGTVETPPGLIVYQIADDYILGKSSDDLGVEHVRVYDLVKTGASS